MKITESQLRKVIRDVIKENNETLNEGYLRHAVFPALLTMSLLSHVGNALDKYNDSRQEQAMHHIVKNSLEGVDLERLFEEMTALGLPISAEGILEYAESQGIKIHDAALFKKLASEYILKRLYPLASENPTSYDGPAGPQSMPESRTRRRRRS
jgi:predicted DNA-binding protein (UPF0278 family)